MHPPQSAEQFVKEHSVMEKESMSDVSIADITDPFWSANVIDSTVSEREAFEMVGAREMRG